MKQENLISLKELSVIYKIDFSFFLNLNDIGLLEIKKISKVDYIHQDQINAVEKMIRLHHELSLNEESIDIVFNLLQKIDSLQNELIFIKNKLRLYEN